MTTFFIRIAAAGLSEMQIRYDGNTAGEKKETFTSTSAEKKLTQIRNAGAAAGPAISTVLTDLAAGDRVTHERFGQGEVRSVEGEFPNTTALIEFDTAGPKKLLLRFAKLTKI